MSGELVEESYGTGKKKLSIYILGMVLCVILTLISFLVVMQGTMSGTGKLTIIFISALVQFVVQVVCFLRLNAKNEAARMNLLSFVFALLILFVLIAGSLWIMWSLGYRMMM